MDTLNITHEAPSGDPMWRTLHFALGEARLQTDETGKPLWLQFWCPCGSPMEKADYGQWVNSLCQLNLYAPEYHKLLNKSPLSIGGSVGHYHDWHPGGGDAVRLRCHFFITDGKIDWCADSEKWQG